MNKFTFSLLAISTLWVAPTIGQQLEILNLPADGLTYRTEASSTGTKIVLARKGLDIRSSGIDVNVSQQASETTILIGHTDAKAASITIRTNSILIVLVDIPKPSAGSSPSQPNLQAKKEDAAKAAADKAADKATDPDTDKEGKALKAVKNFVVDIPVSNSPAFYLLGVSPSEVSRPQSVREWTAQIAQAVDKEGKVKTGLAIEVSPYQLLREGDREYSVFSEDPVERALINSTLSLATVSGKGEDKSARAALGFQVVWIDDAEHARNKKLHNCFMEAKKAAVEEARSVVALPQEIPMAVFSDDGEAQKFWAPYKELRKKALEASFGPARDKCFTGARKEWNGNVLATGIGTASYSKTGAANALERSSRVAWITGGIKAGAIGQLVLHGRRLVDDRASDPSDETKLLGLNSTVYAGRFRIANEKMAGFYEISRTKNDYKDRENDETVRRQAVGIEFKIAKDLWIQMGVGGDKGRLDGKNSSFALANLKLGSTSEPQFSPLPLR